MTTSTAPASATTTFLAVVPAYYGPELPACPDGSGDLWWDDASYLRYQSYDPEYSPAYIADADTANYCAGKVIVDDEPPF